MKHATVLRYPNPSLHQSAVPVEPEQFGGQRLHDVVQLLIATMRQYRGIGIAATQIGIPMQVAVIEQRDGPFTMINPKISRSSFRSSNEEEGCLSVPGVFGDVKRSRSLHLRFQDEFGKIFHIRAQGLFARVIQHEDDHLRGTLFLQRCHRLTSGLEEAKRLHLHIPPLSQP
jgi:peptide deformylase